MTRALIAVLNVIVLAAGAAFLGWPAPIAGADPVPRTRENVDKADTEDVLYLRDGRVLNGRIVSEDSREIVFEYIDRRLNLRTKLTISQLDIEKIERDVPIATAAPAAPKPEPTAIRRDANDNGLEIASRFGTVRSRAAVSDAKDVPGVYLIPMTGQMGTDIRADVYREVVEDVKEKNPDLIVILMESKVSEENLAFVTGAVAIDKNERGIIGLMDEYIDVVNLFQDDLRRYRQVLWVKDAQGVASVIAMSWPKMYMMPAARLYGVYEPVLQAYSWNDPDVRAKMIAAWSASVKSFFEYGGHSLQLAEAMTRPERKLSASWKGREVEWQLDTDGEYLVDSSDKVPVQMRAKAAEDLLVSDGTADSLDDLLLLEDMHEFRIVDGNAIKIVDGYIEDWRRLFDQTKEWLRDFQQSMQRAGGDETIAYLGRAKKDLERVVSAMNRYKAIELRWQMEGVQKLSLIAQAEQISEQIRAIRNAGRGATGGGGRGAQPG